MYITIYYIISFKLYLKLKFNNNKIVIFNTIFNQYSIATIFNIDQLFNMNSNCIINIIMITIVVDNFEKSIGYLNNLSFKNKYLLISIY